MNKKLNAASDNRYLDFQTGASIECLIPIAEVAAERCVSIRTVRNWISRGLIVAYKRNNHAILVDPRSLDNLLTRIR